MKGKKMNNNNNYYYYNSFVFDRRGFCQNNEYFALRKNEVSFSLAIGKEEIMHECFPKHSRMGTAIMK